MLGLNPEDPTPSGAMLVRMLNIIVLVSFCIKKKSQDFLRYYYLRGGNTWKLHKAMPGKL
jgi:hypothetical protein